MQWEKLDDDEWWYVYGHCFIAEEKEYWKPSEKQETYYEVGQWGRHRTPERYPTLEAAMLAAEMIFG